jgi:hypothetical protein
MTGTIACGYVEGGVRVGMVDRGVDGPAKFASIMNVLTLYLRISCSAHFG